MLFKDMTQYEITRSMVVAELDERAASAERMLELKKLYDNRTEPLKAPSMSDRIYEGRCEAFTPVAFTSMLVDKIAGLQYSRNVDRKIASSKHDKALKSAYVGSQSAFMRLAKISSLCGFAAVRLNRKWDGSIAFVTYGFNEVAPILDPDDPHGKPMGLKFDVRTSDLPSWARSQVAEKPIHNFVEVITRHRRDDLGRILEAGIYRAFVDDKEVVTPSKGLNVLGDYLGAVYWRGLDHPYNPHGKSDVLPLLETLTSLNELMTDGRELMIWGMHSPIITNAQGKLDWKYSPRSVFQIKAVAGEGAPFAQRLGGATESISDFKIFVEMLLNIFHQTSRIPSVSVGDLDGIGKASSGRAFEIAMTPAKELIAEKENTCIPQELILMSELLAKMIYYGDVEGRTYPYHGVNMPDCIYINNIMKGASVTFAPIAVPQESSPETRSSQVASRIKSRETAIQELHPGWTEQEVKDELALTEPEKPVEPAVVPDTVAGPVMPIEGEEAPDDK